MLRGSCLCAAIAFEIEGEVTPIQLCHARRYRKAFCGRCGSPMPVALEGSPFVILQAGVLDDDPGTRPFRHAFVAQKAEWYEPGDALPRFDARPPGPDES